MTQPLMPKATAVWLIDNTALTFEQIADFCSLHILEVKGIADGDVDHGIRGADPIAAGQLTRLEIEDCQKDSKSKLKAIPDAFIDLSNTGTKEMLKNFAVLANSLAVDLNAIYKSMNNFKILMNTYFIEWQPDIALGAAEEFKILKTNVNAGFKKGGATHRLKEQKVTANSLKKLISESFKR